MKTSDHKRFYDHHEIARENGAKLPSHGRKALGSRPTPAPSKWDDAQKWLVGLSGGRTNNRNADGKPRSSNADDQRLLEKLPNYGRDSCSSTNGPPEDNEEQVNAFDPDGGETKKIDCNGSLRIKTSSDGSQLDIQSVCVRDMGTEMTPIASQEPSRTATPLRATTPSGRSPVSSRSSTPGRIRGGKPPLSERKNQVLVIAKGNSNNNGSAATQESEPGYRCVNENHGVEEEGRSSDSLEARAMAWDEAERAKYMARYKREEVKILAWEKHENRKAELEMRRIEVKAERLKMRAQERMATKIAATRRIAEEKRANAEAKLMEQAAKTSERAEYIRRTGNLPSSFKLPALCS